MLSFVGQRGVGREILCRELSVQAARNLRRRCRMEGMGGVEREEGDRVSSRHQ